METDDFDTIMERIERKLDQHGFTERDASLQAVGKPDLIRDMKRRRALPGSARLGKLAQLLGTSSDWLMYGDELVRSEVRGTGLSARDAETAWRGPSRAKPVPLMGVAFGGEFGGGIEMTELHLSEVLDYLARPNGVAADPAAYAVEIIGDSMAPRFEPGERAFVSPRSPVRIGDDVIVQLLGDGEDQVAGQIVMVLIKRLVKRSHKNIELCQFNPKKSFTVPLDRIAHVHRVKGRL